MLDSLDAMLAAARAYAAQQKVPLIFGTVIDPEMTMATIRIEPDTNGQPDEDHAADDLMKEFRTAIAAFDVQALVATVVRVDADGWEEAQAAWAAADADVSEQSAIGFATMKRTLATAGNPVGRIAELTLSAIVQQPSLHITQCERADWYDAVIEYDSMLAHLRGEDPDDDVESPHNAARQEAWRRQDEENQARAAEHRKWSGARRSQFITLLANHPKFPACKKEEARMLLFSRIVGDDEVPQDRELIRTITREALALYDLEVRGN